MMRHRSVLIFFILFPCLLKAQSEWQPASNNTYSNPVIHADFSDPDVCRAGNDFYMTASSFNCVPGLPVLHSTDLVNWKLINYALPRLSYAPGFDKPQHGKGVWAPCIRYHNEMFYIFFPDPDHGIFMVKAKHPAGKWTDPVCVKEGKGIIDPTPLWDDDGKAYLAYAFAGSRAGIKSLLAVCSMSEDGTQTYNDDVIVFDGHDAHPTVEGPKFYKRNGYYYIFAPAGGVSTGWQLVLRSKNVFGPYEPKIVMHQGSTNINGPHQGAWVEGNNNEHWFIHFQDKGPYGRVVHLQPMQWKNDWPLMGVVPPGSETGEPVERFKRPDLPAGKAAYPVESDEFNSGQISLAWQWHANPRLTWAIPNPSKGTLRLFAAPPPENAVNLWDVPNLLLQKFPSPAFQATAAITFKPLQEEEQTGLVIMGRDYALLSVKKKNGKLWISQIICKDADKGSAENIVAEQPLHTQTFFLRVKVSSGALCEFSYSEDGTTFRPLGIAFTARQGIWIGAKVGLFCLRKTFSNDAGYADVDWFRFEPPTR